MNNTWGVTTKLLYVLYGRNHKIVKVWTHKSELGGCTTTDMKITALEAVLTEKAKVKCVGCNFWYYSMLTLDYDTNTQVTSLALQCQRTALTFYGYMLWDGAQLTTALPHQIDSCAFN